MGKGLEEAVAVLEGLDLKVGGLLEECALAFLTSRFKFSESAKVASDVRAGLLLVLLHAVLDDPVVKILASKWVSPAVARNETISSSTANKDTLKVPPPKCRQ